jgi:hypothetical protein
MIDGQKAKLKDSAVISLSICKLMIAWNSRL